MRNETAFSQWVCRRLRETGAMILNIHGHSMQQAGWPDLYVSCREYHGFLELKHEKGQLSKLQERTLEGLWKRGDSIGVLLYSTERVREKITLMDHTCRVLFRTELSRSMDLRGLLKDWGHCLRREGIEF